VHYGKVSDAVGAAVTRCDGVVVVASLVVYRRCVVGAEGWSLLEPSGRKSCFFSIRLRCCGASVTQIGLCKVH
jgi:hypothetical protein